VKNHPEKGTSASALSPQDFGREQLYGERINNSNLKEINFKKKRKRRFGIDEKRKNRINHFERKDRKEGKGRTYPLMA